MSGASPAPPGLAPMYGAPQTPTPVAVPQVNLGQRGFITNFGQSGGMYRDLILRGGPPSPANLRLRCSPTCGAATSTATTPCSSHAWTSSGELSILYVVSQFSCRIICLAHQVQQPQPQQQQQQHFQGYQQQPMYHQQGAQYHNPPAPQYHQMVSSQLMDEILPYFTL